MRCGEAFERRDAADRYCRDCIRVLATRALHPEPSWQPEWRRRAVPKVLDHGRLP